MELFGDILSDVAKSVSELLAAKRWSALLLLAIAAFIRAPTFDQPLLHLDEDFYLLVGHHWLQQGLWPYVDIWDRKPPGLFLLYGGISLIGGDGFLAYQIVATLFAAATAWFILQTASLFATRQSAFVAAVIYLGGLVLYGGYGGQAPVFYNLFVAAAAWIIAVTCFADRATDKDAKHVFGAGLLAMLMLGCAIQIKPTAGFEGIYFGLALIWRCRGLPAWRILRWAIVWVAVATLPTLVAIITYWTIGGLDAFVFANLTSILRRGSSFTPASAQRLLTLLGIAAPLILLSLVGLRKSVSAAARFAQGWSLVSLLAVIAFGTYYLHYGLPMLVPLSICAAAGLDRLNLRKPWAFGFIALFILASSAHVSNKVTNRGSRAELAEILKLLPDGEGHCPYFTGSTAPTLYLLSQSCQPSRFVISGHLFEAHEARAIGVDQRSELRRIMAGQPKLVTLEQKMGTEEDPATRRYFMQLLARDYRLVAVRPLGRVNLLVFGRI